MKREEAIKILNEIIDDGWLISDFDKCIAIDACKMAIKALEKEPCCNCIEFKKYAKEIGFEINHEHCDDAVSRKAVVDFLKNHSKDFEDKRSRMAFRAASSLVENPDNIPPVTHLQKWIPVSERLPKPFEYVNCTCHSLVDDREDWVIETCYVPLSQNSPFSDWGNIPMLNSRECEVIAWIHRDIPEPYKAESE